VTTDSKYDLIEEPWRTRFLAAGRDPVFQKVQIATALAAFEVSGRKIKQTMPLVVSERAMAFMLDVANQFGDAGTQSVVSTVMKRLKPGASEADFMAAVGGETVARVARQFGPASNEARSTSSRRDQMRTTPWLSDKPLVFA
jgi:hypothetical protein